jgi:hypothetical protein
LEVRFIPLNGDQQILEKKPALSAIGSNLGNRGCIVLFAISIHGKRRKSALMEEPMQAPSGNQWITTSETRKIPHFVCISTATCVEDNTNYLSPLFFYST